jgi:very-short-patch-repair endonuclease
MAHLTAAAHRHFATHHGIASVDQLIACGLTFDRIQRIRQDGGLDLVLPGAYRTPSAPFDELARCAAVCIAHPEVAIAGPTAGRLWGFRRLPDDHQIHILAPPRSHPTRTSWVVPYRTAAVHESDIIERSDGIRLTSRARTALDLARFVAPLDLRSIIEQAMSDGRYGDAEMYEVAVDWLSPRRPWVRCFLEQFDRRVRGGAAESHYELVLGEALDRAGVRGLVRQHAVTLPGYGPARFDLAVPDLKWAIEIDVHPTHGESSGIRSDAKRDTAASSLGWSVSRVVKAGFGTSLPATIDRLLIDYQARRAQLR